MAGRWEYKPNERICRKAADLWFFAMKVPEFDQLGKTRSEQDEISRQREMMGQAMTLALTKNTTLAQLEIFREELYRILTTEYPFKDLELDTYPHRPSGQPWISEESLEWMKSDQWVRRLGTDYDPDLALWAAGLKAGLPRAQFPIKTRMFIEMTYISFRQGYGDEGVYYYPLPDNQWLVTSLSGSAEDIENLKKLALEHPNAFRVDVDD
jgi:hypothetical protein